VRRHGRRHRRLRRPHRRPRRRDEGAAARVGRGPSPRPPFGERRPVLVAREPGSRSRAVFRRSSRCGQERHRAPVLGHRPPPLAVRQVLRVAGKGNVVEAVAASGRGPPSSCRRICVAGRFSSLGLMLSVEKSADNVFKVKVLRENQVIDVWVYIPSEQLPLRRFTNEATPRI
jgi:hypothetical protein